MATREDELVGELNKVLDLPVRPRPAPPWQPAEEAQPASSPAPTPPPGEGDKDQEAIPLAAMDGNYAALRPYNHAIARLHVVDRQGRVRSFEYVHLDSDSRFEQTEDGDGFVLWFTWGVGAQRVQMTVQGRNLWRMYDYITLHRWPYLRVAARDFGGAGEEVVTAVDIEPVGEQQQRERGRA